MKKLLLKTIFISLFMLACMLKLSAQHVAASATWQPASGANIPGSVVKTGTIVAAEQQGTLEANTYSSTTTAVNDATGFQRLRSGTTAPQLPFGNAVDPNFYLQYTVSPDAPNFLRVSSFKITIMGGGTGNCRLVAKYSRNGTDFVDMPVAGNYFLADGTAQTYAATAADPVVLINTGAAAMPEAKRTLTFSNMVINLDPGESFTIRLYPYLTDLSAGSNRYVMTRQTVVSAFSQAISLPLDFLSFTAKADAFGKTAQLNWKTTNEVNTKEFEIEKRTDHTNFISIGTKKSLNTPGTNSYAFVDNNLSSGNTYYRLKQVDADGKFKYSDIESINNRSLDQVKLYPNPVTKGFTLEHPLAEVNGTLSVFNMAGAEMLNKTVLKGTTQTYVDIANLPIGMYLVRYKVNGELISQKIIKN